MIIGYSPDHEFFRRSDPATSAEAAEKIAPKVIGHEAKFVAVLRKSTIPLTAQEIAEVAFPNDRVKRETIRKRANGLIKKGFVRIAGQRKCTLTGNNATTYEVIK
jgi:hypothetical protein